MPLVNRSVNNVPFRVKPSLHQAFLQVVDVIVSHMHCCIQHPSKVSLKYMITLVHFDEAMIHLMQFSLIISRCNNITFSLFGLSQGSVATLIRWDGWSSYVTRAAHLKKNLTVETALKPVDFWRSYRLHGRAGPSHPYSTGSSCPIGCRTGHGRLAGSGGLDGDGSP